MKGPLQIRHVFQAVISLGPRERMIWKIEPDGNEAVRVWPERSRSASTFVSDETHPTMSARERLRRIQRWRNFPVNEAGQSVFSPRAPRTASKSWQVMTTGTSRTEVAYMALE